MFMKKNQVIVFVLALLLVTVGYLGIGKDVEGQTQEISSNSVGTVGVVNNENTEKDENETIGDATLVNGPALVPNEEGAKSDASSVTENNNASLDNAKGSENTTETANTNVIQNEQAVQDDYFASSKLQRDTMYSQSLSSYQKMIDSTEISAEQKAIAQNEIIKINNQKNAIMIMENLITAKGFKDVVIFINQDSVNVVVKADKLNTEDVAKIQNIVSRETDTEIGNIHITNK